MTNGSMGMAGNLSVRKVAGSRPAPLSWRVANRLRLSFWVGLIAVMAARLLSGLTGVPTLTSELRAVHRRRDGTQVDYGVLSYRVVTSAFVAFVVDQLQTETSVFGDFKFHDSGVGTTAENASDTAIETTDGEARATGTQTEASANQYRSVGTITYSTSKAITEHGLFNDASAGTLMDRSVFSAINVVNGDSIQFTYTLTLNSGS